MKLLNKFDLFLIGLLVASFATATWLLYMVDQNAVHEAHTKQVGTITYKNHFAERKVNGEVVWGGLDQSAPVYNDDTVRTTTDSSAVIKLVNQTEISMGEKTMVLVNIAPQGTNINISGGLVSVRRTASASADGVVGAKQVAETPIVMTTQSGSVTLDTGAVSIAEIEGKTAVNVEAGNVTVSSGDSTQQVAVNSVVGLNGQAPVVMKLVPLSPQAGTVQYLSKDQPKVHFQWSVSDGTQLDDRTARLLIATDSDFKHVIHQEKIGSTSSDVDLPEGSLYWKLSMAGIDTPPRWFSILKQRAPRVVEPVENKNYIYVESPPLVRFSWIPLDFAVSYRIDVFSEGDPKTPIISQSSALANLSIDSLKPGNYSWQLVAISGYQSKEFASTFRHFRIRNDQLHAPAVLPTTTGTVVANATLHSRVGVGNGEVLTSWQDVDGADSYHAIVSRDTAGKDVVATVETTSHSLRLDKDLDPGTYFVRVSAVSGTIRSEPSAALPIKVVDPFPLRALVPADQSTLDPGARPFAFRWSDPNNGNKYRLVFTRQAMTDPFLNIESLVAQSQVTFPQDISGDISWKVELMDQNNSVIASSNPVSFYLPRLFADPQPIQPINGDAIDVFVSDTIVLRWQPISGAAGYLVSLYRMTGGLKTAIQSWSTDQTSITIDDFTALSTDPYAWDLSAFSYSGKQLTGQSRTIMSFFRIIQSEPVRLPQKFSFGEGDE